MNISKNNFFYQLATWWDDSWTCGENQTDICTIGRKAFKGTMLAVTVTLLVVAVILSLLAPPVSLIAYWITDIVFIPFFSEPSFFGGLFLYLIMALAAVGASVDWIFTKGAYYFVNYSTNKPHTPRSAGKLSRKRLASLSR